MQRNRSGLRLAILHLTKFSEAIYNLDFRIYRKSHSLNIFFIISDYIFKCICICTTTKGSVCVDLCLRLSSKRIDIRKFKLNNFNNKLAHCHAEHAYHRHPAKRLTFRRLTILAMIDNLHRRCRRWLDASALTARSYWFSSDASTHA